HTIAVVHDFRIPLSLLVSTGTPKLARLGTVSTAGGAEVDTLCRVTAEARRRPSRHLTPSDRDGSTAADDDVRTGRAPARLRCGRRCIRSREVSDGPFLHRSRIALA